MSNMLLGIPIAAVGFLLSVYLWYCIARALNTLFDTTFFTNALMVFFVLCGVTSTIASRRK